ncbi:MAG: 50S ribosomal protein L5 [Dissulfurimicrobium sp.]|uniref:50S ribosomal protein L5 n=1 Tax=Dissulfurimicrobium sp. TaxID=2022436 RepID=UPI00404A59AC
MVLVEQQYKEVAIPKLMEHFGYTNILQVPKLEKVVLNMGLGEAIQNFKIIDNAVEELTRIAGQRAVITRAKKSIAAFKLRAGLPIGCRVTLRRHKMYDFLTKLIHIAIPRIRDFRGLSTKGFDGRGNYTLGIKEQIIFPEIEYDKIDKIKGLNVTIVTTAKTDQEAKYLLDAIGMPFRK